MKKLSKRLKKATELVDKTRAYPLQEAIQILKKVPRLKFDESVDLAFNLNIDPKQSSQMVRGTVSLPHGTGKTKRVLVFCKGEAATFAKEAGAEHVGGIELVEKVSKGFLDFDTAISTPEMMKDVGKLGKLLGPRGLMPSPKAGTVTTDVAKAIKDLKGGKIEFKMDKLANINSSIGKISFEEKALKENAESLINAVIGARPASVKGKFIGSITISSTMGPGLRLDLAPYKL